MQLTVQGKGNAARNGGINGNLLVVIEEEPDPQLERDGDDLIYSLFISIPQAVNGCQVEIPAIDGKLKIKVEPGTQPGKVLRLRGKGLPSVNGYGTGDLLVFVQVWIPKKLDRAEKEMMAQLENSENFKANPSQDDKNLFDRVKQFFS